MSAFSISRRLEIDAAHRIAGHGSKCRYLHGHRYVIEACCISASLHTNGAKRGMVLDFGFLKEEMARTIDEPCDHGLLVSVDDQELLAMLAPVGRADAWVTELEREVRRAGHCSAIDGRLGGLIYVLDAPPTAEVLAQHWFQQLKPRVNERSSGQAHLTAVTVWETPNCWARYEGPEVVRHK
ncbi:MAG: 6-carboxytetrahydropterin synthase [Nitrococcus mobilis]|nr:6-carboxytetrahydropterin synthase [Nitrococcus mobilis]